MTQPNSADTPHSADTTTTAACPTPVPSPSAPRPTVNTLVTAAKKAGTRDLSEFLTATGHSIDDVYRGTGTWTTILRRAELAPTPAELVAGEAELLKRMRAFLHVDDAERAAEYRQFTHDDARSYDDLSEFEQGYARMLFFNLWDKAGGHSTYSEGLASLRSQPAVRAELAQLLDHLVDSGRMRDAQPLEGPHVHIPLHVHHAYNRSEILAAMGVARLGGQLPGFFAQGVLWDAANRTDSLLITLTKNASDFAESVRYKDYPVSRTRFHWESQNATAPESATGQRYQNHAKEGSHVLLFLRKAKDVSPGRAMPWVLLGPATYEKHTGSKPMGITWKLHHPMPDWLYAHLPHTTPTP
ncbi:DUF3427 domain-containing protein [Streptomyces sp. NBC_00470]|uniref:DUF3427 domain-containing protein n=1 Tax=Streptomyces sp. NBC_00470 TaxID=2975753 RepID=UPI002F909DF8